MTGKVLTVFFDRKKEKYYVKYPKAKAEKTNFKVLGLCDARINRIRNRNYKTVKRAELIAATEKYFNTDYEKHRSFFFKDTNDYVNYCYDEYVLICDSNYTAYLQQIESDYATRKVRYNEYVKNGSGENPLFISAFLRDFESCSFDFAVFYDLMVHHTRLLLAGINRMNSAQYAKLSIKTLHLPKELNKEAALIKMKECTEPCIHKDVLLKTMKTYWRQ